MKAVALAAPGLVLGVLHLLHKMEVWVLDEPGTVRDTRPVRRGRHV